MVETLRTQACVHILRSFAQTRFREPKSSGTFTRAERRILTEYLAENLTRDVSLAEMAGVVGLSEFHFSRKNHQDFTYQMLCQGLQGEQIREIKRIAANMPTDPDWKTRVSRYL